MELEEIRNITVIGTGMIGPDISLACTMAGYAVTMVGRREASLEKGLARYGKNLRNLVAAGLYSEAEAERVRSRLATSTDAEEAVGNADFLFEGIVENLETKQKLFARLERHCPERTLMASSTSGLSPNDIGAGMRRRDRMLVMHFWNPPYLVPLVEVLAGEQTSPQVVELSLAFLRGLGKEPVLLKKDVPGHIGNRLQHALFREAIHLVQEGVATAEDIDRVILSSLGPRYSMIGPMEYMDSVGLDLQVAVQSYLFRSLADDKEPQPLLMERYRQGHFGAKSGRGFHDWSARSLEEMTSRQNRRFIDRLKARERREESSQGR